MRSLRARTVAVVSPQRLRSFHPGPRRLPYCFPSTRPIHGAPKQVIFEVGSAPTDMKVNHSTLPLCLAHGLASANRAHGRPCENRQNDTTQAWPYHHTKGDVSDSAYAFTHARPETRDPDVISVTSYLTSPLRGVRKFRRTQRAHRASYGVRTTVHPCPCRVHRT